MARAPFARSLETKNIERFSRYSRAAGRLPRKGVVSPKNRNNYYGARLRGRPTTELPRWFRQGYPPSARAEDRAGWGLTPSLRMESE
jgi:hypothetical protein